MERWQTGIEGGVLRRSGKSAPESATTGRNGQPASPPNGEETRSSAALDHRLNSWLAPSPASIGIIWVNATFARRRGCGGQHRHPADQPARLAFTAPKPSSP